jgi:hypothetical protein
LARVVVVEDPVTIPTVPIEGGSTASEMAGAPPMTAPAEPVAEVRLLVAVFTAEEAALTVDGREVSGDVTDPAAEVSTAPATELTVAAGEEGDVTAAAVEVSAAPGPESDATGDAPAELDIAVKRTNARQMPAKAAPRIRSVLQTPRKGGLWPGEGSALPDSGVVTDLYIATKSIGLNTESEILAPCPNCLDWPDYPDEEVKRSPNRRRR